MTTRRKLPPRIEPRSTAVRPLATAPLGSLPGYASVFAAAKVSALRAMMVIAPLGALAGTVSACGGAAPVQPSPAFMDPTRSHQSANRWGDPDPEPPAPTTSAAASAAPVRDQQR